MSSDAAWIKGLRTIVSRYGGQASEQDIRAAVIRAQTQAQAHSESEDGVDQHEVLRIRLSKFLASRIPADVYADRLQHAEIRQALRSLIDTIDGEAVTQPDLFPNKKSR